MENFVGANPKLSYHFPKPGTKQRITGAWKFLKDLPRNTGLLILGTIQKVSFAWHQGENTWALKTHILGLDHHVEYLQSQIKWYQGQVEQLQARTGLTKPAPVRYTSNVKPVAPVDHENYMQSLTDKELKQMERELDEAITKGNTIIHGDD